MFTRSSAARSPAAFAPVESADGFDAFMNCVSKRFEANLLGRFLNLNGDRGVSLGGSVEGRFKYEEIERELERFLGKLIILLIESPRKM